MLTLIAVFWTCLALLAYIFVLYPGLMACIGLLPPSSKQGKDGSPRSVSLILPVHNEATVIAAKLRDAASVRWPGTEVEIILVSDGSDDETLSIARQMSVPHLRILELARGGKATALNRGVREATGEILCFSDANVQFAPDALVNLASHFSDPQIGAVTGDVRLESELSDFGAGESLFYKIERAVQLGETRLGSVMGVDGGMYAIRRALFPELPRDTILDDFVVSMEVIRQGYRIAYEPAAYAIESATPTSAAEFKRRVRVSAGSIQVLKRRNFPPLNRPVELWQFLSHKLLRWSTPYLTLTLLVSNMLLAREHSFYLATLGAQVVAYTLGLAAAASPSLRNWRYASIPYYFLLSHFAMIVGHIRGLLNRQAVTWTRTERISAEHV